MSGTVVWLLGGIAVGIILALLGTLNQPSKDGVSALSMVGLAIGYTCTICFVNYQRRRTK